MSGHSDRVFDVEKLERLKAESARMLRPVKSSRRGRQFAPNQLDLFPEAPAKTHADTNGSSTDRNAANGNSPQHQVGAETSPALADARSEICRRSNGETDAPKTVDAKSGSGLPVNGPKGSGASARGLNGNGHTPSPAGADAPRSRRTASGNAGLLAIDFAAEREALKPSRDYRITAESKIGEGSLREKAERNLAAIRLLKAIECDGREATLDAKHILARFTGWGAMPAVFDYYTYKRDEWNGIRDALRELLTDDEHRRAQASVPNAHYTSAHVVEAIWQALEHLGIVSGARILEPSVGTGNFFGLMPETLMRKSLRAGVELDSITARIAKVLYPDANIFETGFEDAPLPDNFFDVEVGNVPFGNYGVHDARYKSWQTASIHNYFFIKALDKLREGGVLAFITSRYTMDAKDRSNRDYLERRANFLGAIRLPNSTFEENAGTKVTTDIIFLQKRPPGSKPSGPKWQYLRECVSPGRADPIPINEYFVENPQMMLGAMRLESGAFGMEPELIGQISREKLQNAIAVGLPRGIYQPRCEHASPIAAANLLQETRALDAVKNGAYVVVGDVLKQRRDNQFLTVAGKPKVDARIRGMIRIRDCVRAVFKTQLDDESDSVIVEAREALGHAYGRFVREFGSLSSRENRLAFADDPDAPLLLSLEERYGEKSGKARKGAIFEKRTLERYRPIESVETAAEALTVSLNEFGRIDWPRMSALTGRTVATLRCELDSLVYENPETGAWETADQYLSGNVRQKLTAARHAAALDKKYLRNVAALESAQPTDLGPEEIAARLGATWIPPDEIADFAASIIGAERDAVRVDYVTEIATWAITAKEAAKANVGNLTTHGTSRFTALELIEDALNGRVPTVYDFIVEGGQEKRSVNEQKTLEAREAQQKLKEKFVAWIWGEEERAARLAGIYNEQFNALRLRTYDGSHLTFPGMNKSVLRDGDLAPHQKNAVWRILQGESTLLAHCVGAGKTWIMTAAAMEAKRIGLARKSMMVVPNHLVEQWGAAFLQLYPQANIFVAGKEHFQVGKRERAMSRIATGDYDAVIVSHRSFELLPVADGLFEKYLQAELDALDEAIRELRSEKSHGGSRRIVKMLETARKRLARKIEEHADREKKDNAITFEELGVDRVFVDEADLYKNLGFVTKMSRIAGLPQSTSNRATDMHIKTRWLRERNGGKGVVFATGTPISNTMAEMYTMQRYLAPEVLAKAGMTSFDAWAANFGEAVTALELAPSGAGYRMHTRFAKFVNLPELLTMFRDFADVQTAEMLNLPRPALHEGSNRIITSPSTPELKAFVDRLVARSERIRQGNVDPRDDNMLKITSEGRKAALDMRLVDPGSEVGMRSKVNLVIAEIFRIWEETAVRKSTQLAFCDLSTPQADGFHVYGAIRDGLIALGVPPHEIAFIHDAETDAEKQILFDKLNCGDVRILLGSTEKMGAGTNVQRKLVASHNLDAPWRPRDIEQRDGRILRQGNENAEVLIYRYVTEGSFDAYMWQTLETKAKFIQQVMTGDTSVRTTEDITGGALTYAEIKAIASGNPAVMEKVKVDTEVRRLDSLRTSHLRRQFEMRARIGPTETKIAVRKEQLADVRADIVTRDANKAGEFLMTVAGRDFRGKDAREEAAKALNETIHGQRRNPSPTVCARMAGVEVLCRGDPDGIVSTFLRGAAAYSTNYNAESPLGTLMSVERTLQGFETVQSRLEDDIHRDETALAEYRLQSEKPFEHEAKLKELLAEQARLNAKLDLNKDDRQATVVGNEGEIHGEEKSSGVPAGPIRRENGSKARARQKMAAEPR